ncbi:ABC transporter ATP-binding protein [Pseudomonas neuropathica]|mgnify:CR=1 FL=1|jgi:lipopolysaccharide transport system ATP-binding protein|uniref:ABC transporter ATP-binding protein n=1 Tax=Pseudomonas TaxID=286 RepID=UPI001BAE9A78|nr:ABC transporter ATP-binding protein [Pseudomonas sp. SCA2728.1_7]QUE90226.1 ABC transporter ATP-binding protein [Pseudomonas sp. SCA2728.1_7]WRH91091.1 ABC transporter ATP-binding protein [Pseudomonas fluorescens]
MTVLLEVNDLWKKYSRDLKSSVKYAARDILRGAVSGGQNDHKDLRDSEFWAIRGMNFSLRRGEVLGVLGHNGAGKSTLLKCIAGKLAADRGSVIRNGELGYLLEMSAGFSPTMTGRDNVTVRGRLMGMNGKALAAYIDEVKDFSELDTFFDSPVQFYSSGMKSRLGFAASSVIRPDILIIDEVLAVGDLSFRLRCYERVNELARNAAVIFVSHSIGQVARLCNRAIFLEKGKVLYEGGVQNAISLYQDKLGDQNERKRGHTLHPELISFSLMANGCQLVPGQSLPYGANLSLDIDISKLPENAVIRPLLRDGSQGVLADWNSVRSNLSWPAGRTRLKADLGSAELAPGAYSISIEVMSPDGVEHISLSESTPFRIGGSYLNAVAIQKTATWQFPE